MHSNSPQNQQKHAPPRQRQDLQVTPTSFFMSVTTELPELYHDDFVELLEASDAIKRPSLLEDPPGNHTNSCSFLFFVHVLLLRHTCHCMSPSSITRLDPGISVGGQMSPLPHQCGASVPPKGSSVGTLRQPLMKASESTKTTVPCRKNTHRTS